MRRSTHDHSPPEGYVPLPTPEKDSFTAHAGPFYVRFDGDDLLLGFRVEQRHSNPAGICHGGAMMTFADVCMGVAAAVQSRLPVSYLPTINLSGDFLAPTPIGAWVEGRTQMLRATKRFVFAQALSTADGSPVLRTSGVFSIPSHPQFPINLAEALQALMANSRA